MSSSTSPTLPALDCHAHLAQDVTAEQLDALGQVTVFAVTRSLEEGEEVARRTDPQLVWGCGVHPGRTRALSSYDADRFRNLIQRFVLIGEVGLDRRAGKVEEQKLVFRSILNVIRDLPVITSIHSAGCTTRSCRSSQQPPTRERSFTGSLGPLTKSAPRRPSVATSPSTARCRMRLSD